MPIDINFITETVKKAGSMNVRIVPMVGQDMNHGNHQIEVNQNGQWTIIAAGVKRTLAEQMVNQALNRTICG